MSLPQDRAKEGVVRSRTLGACNLSRSLLQCQARQNFPPLVRGGMFSVGCEELHASSARPPPPHTHTHTHAHTPAWQVLFGSWLCWVGLFHPVVFTCTLCVAPVDSLVSQVGSSFAAGTFAPGGWVDLSLCYVRNYLLAGFCDSALRLRFCTAFRTCLRRVKATASSFVLVSVVSSWQELLFHI